MDKTALTIDAYNTCASNFESSFMDLKLYKANLNKFIDLIPINAKILDLGCGPGNIARLLSEKQKNLQILGIDLSTEMIKLATKNVPSATFQVGDIRNLSGLANDFDAVIAAFSIVHLSNDETFNLIKDVNRLLKSKGLLYISCIEGNNSDYLKTSFSSEKNIYFNHFTEDFITRALTNTNFSIINNFKQDYPEPDGTTSTELFFYARKTL